MNSTDLLNLFRREMSDRKAPYLWDSETLFIWMNEAQEMFCRKTDGIEDSSTVAVCRIPVVADTEWYSLSRKILKTRRATRMDTGREIPIINMEKAPAKGVVFNGKSGPLNVFVSGMEKSRLRAWPIPNEAVTVELSVFRLPLEPITDAGDEEFEIDEQHHLSLLHWMKHRAYGKEDAETFDRRKADEFEDRFLRYCAAAKDEQTRARREVGTVLYGGL